MVDGGHFKNALAVCSLEIDALDNHGHGIPDINDAEEKHQFGAVHHKGQRRDHAAEEHAAGIAHKDLGRVKVPQQKAHTGTRRGSSQQRDMYKAQQAARQKIPQHRDKGHAGAKAVKAVGQVDGIDQKDNAEKRDGIVRQPQIDHARDREHDAGGQQPQAVQADHKADRNGDLENNLLPGSQAQIAVLDDLDEVIQEADQAIAECEKQHQHACGHLLLAQHFGRRGMEQPIHHAKRE